MGSIMKKIISLFLVLVLCIACISAPAYAEELDTPENPVDIDEYVIAPCYGSNTIYSSYDFSITVEVSGDAPLNSYGMPVSFTCTNYSSSMYYTSGFGYASVSYSSYSISGNYIYVYFNYNAVYTDINGVIYNPSGSGTVTICV